MAEPIKRLDLSRGLWISDIPPVKYADNVNTEVSWHGGRLFGFIPSFFSRFRIFAASVAALPANIDPLAIDDDTMKSINDKLDEVAGQSFNTCDSRKKAEVLGLTLGTGGKLGLNYERRMDVEPQTVKEFLKTKTGNCGDFSRLLVAVAKAKGLQVQMLLITFQSQDEVKNEDQRIEEQHLAVFSIKDQTYYLDLSNNVLRSYPYKDFGSIQELIKKQIFKMT